MLRLAFFYAFLVGTTIYALWKGGWPERAVALLFLFAAFATLVVRPEYLFHDLEKGVLLVDSALFLALLAIALRAERFWPLWMTALQGISVAGH